MADNLVTRRGRWTWTPAERPRWAAAHQADTWRSRRWEAAMGAVDVFGHQVVHLRLHARTQGPQGLLQLRQVVEDLVEHADRGQVLLRLEGPELHPELLDLYVFPRGADAALEAYTTHRRT